MVQDEALVTPKARSEKSKEGVSSNSNSSKNCKSVGKKIKIPKFEESKNDNMNSTAVNFKMETTKEELGMNRRPSKNRRMLRSLNSFSPKKAYHKSRLNMSIDGITDFSGKAIRSEYKKQSLSISKRYMEGKLFHMHWAGPGSYDLPPLMGGYNHVSGKNNNP